MNHYQIQRLHILGFAILSLYSNKTAAVSAYNATIDKDQVVCVYQLSGQYGILQRILTYSLFAFIALARDSVWLVAGAMAWIMTYSGTAAVHAFLLAISSRGLYDLDSVGIWTILSISCLAVLTMFDCSSAIPHLPTRPIFGLWGTFISLGAILALVSLLRDYPTEPECRSSSGSLLRDISGTLEPTFNCTYTCFDHKQILRSSKDLAIVSKKRAFGISFKLILATMVITGLLGFMVTIFSYKLVPGKRTEAELRECIKRNTPRLNDSFKKAKRKRDVQRCAREELATGKLRNRDPLFHPTILLYLLLIIVVIILNEIYLLADHPLPFSQDSYAIDQWGSWVAVILALVAALFVRSYLPRFLERQKILDQEKAARELTKKPGLAQDQDQAEQGQPSSDSGKVDLQSPASVTTSTKDQSIQALGAETEA